MPSKDKTKKNAQNRAWRQRHPAQQRAIQQVWYKTLVAEALRILGHKCACPGCGISEPLFLTLDHIDGRPKGPRKNAFKEARDSGWDKTKFQILCFNCNCAKSDLGFCPVHQKGPAQRDGHSPGAHAQLGLPLMIQIRTPGAEDGSGPVYPRGAQAAGRVHGVEAARLPLTGWRPLATRSSGSQTAPPVIAPFTR